jgi:uncharacterized DUF497 family protein
MLGFEWDPDKASHNLKKHGVSFEEASTVFFDALSLTIPDPDHSNGEVRQLMLGRSVYGQLLVVSFTERWELIRIISSRKASRREVRQYEEGFESETTDES